jgi:hypothetical protein
MYNLIKTTQNLSASCCPVSHYLELHNLLPQ